MSAVLMTMSVTRLSKKGLANAHEEYIAKLFSGKRSRSSGAAAHDAGDVRTSTHLIECKMTGNPGAAVSKPVPTVVRQLEKIAKEAWEEGKTPMLALRYYSPHSVLANANGWIDVTLMLATDMAAQHETA